jgi:Rhodanese-like domain
MDDQDKEARPVRRVRTAPADYRYGPQGPRPPRPGGPPRRDLFPYVLGGLITSGMLGLVLIVWLALSPGRAVAPVATTPTPFTSVPVEFPTANVPLGVITGVPVEVETQDAAIPPAVPTGSPPPEGDPPRMQLGEFKALYDDPATRPIILDTRNMPAFGEGHIPGAVLFPADEVAANVATLPKDKLIVAYCQ